MVKSDIDRLLGPFASVSRSSSLYHPAKTARPEPGCRHQHIFKLRTATCAYLHSRKLGSFAEVAFQ